MPITDIFRGRDLRKELDACVADKEQLKADFARYQAMEAVELKQAIAALRAELAEVEAQASAYESDFTKRKTSAEFVLAELGRQEAEKRKNLVILDDDALLQEVGFYRQRFGLGTSGDYKRRIDEIQTIQAGMIRTGRATSHGRDWMIDGSAAEGAKMVKEYEKLILRAFNNECDAAISDVKFSNVAQAEKRIVKAYDQLNTLGTRMKIRIELEYRNRRLDELYLVFEHRRKLNDEKEEARRRREEMREEAKALKEIEEARTKLAKEARHFDQALAQMRRQLSGDLTDDQRRLLEKEKAQVELELAENQAKVQDVNRREANTRAGYVYVISNIGSFGEDVFKIGVTRRLDPQERVDELGDASVPFRFDVHALIFSEDAPALENALHRAFADRKLNFVNSRREFFKVTLPEIETVVRQNFQKPVDFVPVPEAAEYRESLSARLVASTQPQVVMVS